MGQGLPEALLSSGDRSYGAGGGGRLKGSSDYLPVDHAGPSFVLAVFSREPGGAGTLVPALLEIHAGSIVGTGGGGASPCIWEAEKPVLSFRAQRPV